MHIDPSLQMLACSYISKQLDKLMQHLNGARSRDDIEDVHQVRVACRRMRSAMLLFADCFDEKLLAGWQKQIKKLLKSFGAARDLDVQILFLTERINMLEPEQRKMRSGIRRMLLRWQQKRDAVQPRLIKTIDMVQKKHILTNIHLETEKTLFVLKPHNPPVCSPVIEKRAFEQINHHIHDLLAKRLSMDDPTDVPGHHAARIAAKKLRYAMEICNEALDDKLKPAIKTIKHIQTLLGDIHDCDVWELDIEHFIQDERQRAIDYYGNARPFNRILPGLEYLRTERHTHRQQLFAEAHAYFVELEQQKFWQQLQHTLDALIKDQKGMTHDEPQDEQCEPTADTTEDSGPV